MHLIFNLLESLKTNIRKHKILSVYQRWTKLNNCYFACLEHLIDCFLGVHKKTALALGITLCKTQISRVVSAVYLRLIKLSFSTFFFI